MSTTRVTRDTFDGSVRPIQNIVIQGGTVDNVPIGVTTPNVGHFTNLFATNLTVTGSVNFTGATPIGLNAQYGDLAEYYEGDQDYLPGTVVRIGGDKEITSTAPHDYYNVFGVIATAPAYVMNAQQESTAGGYMLPVAMIGRVPVRVIGLIRKGDPITISSYYGVGQKAEHVGPGSSPIFARALEDKMDWDEGLVNCAVRVHI